MKVLRLFMIGALLISVASLTSCKKDEYQPKGDYVTTGQNNNTVKSATFNVTSGDWQGSSSYWWCDYDASSLDLSGVVMVYLQVGNDYMSLSAANADNLDVSLVFDYDTSTKYIGVTATSISGAAIANPGLKTFKVVTIPASGMKTHPNVNFKSYKAVAKAFNLK